MRNYSLLESIVIPKSITYIGDRAFSWCSGLTSVTIPDSVTSIDDYAFWGCSGLTSITIPDSVTRIGNSVFCECRGLTSVTIPNSVTSIGEDAFSGCRELTSVTIPDRVTSIGDRAFLGCSGLTSVTIPDSVTRIGDSVFCECRGLTSVTIPNSVTSIGEDAFSGCRELTSVTIPDRVTSIGDRAFWGCSGLTSVTIPNSVTSIGEIAFSGCSGLTSVTIPDSVTSIGDGAFSWCSGLTSIDVSDKNKRYCSVDGNLFTKNMAMLVRYAEEKTDSNYSIPYGVSSIAVGAFSGCSRLTSVTIPDSVTSIGSSAFYGCSGLTSITIPDGVTSIGSSAFYGCSGLTSVTIPDSVTSIDSEAFRGCSGLTSVTIPDSVTSIGDYAFYGCINLKDVYYNGSLSRWKNTSKGYYGNDYLTKASVHYLINDTAITAEKKSLSWNYTSDGEYHYWLFSPSVGGTYIFESTLSSGNACGYVYDSGFKELVSDNTGGEKGNFNIVFNAKKGVRYYLGARWYAPKSSGTIPMSIARQYTITYDANGGANAPSSQTKTYGTALNISKTIPTREGYDFLGWSPDKSAVSPVYKSGDSYSADGDTVLYAVWSSKKYTVTYNANGGSGAPAAQTKTHGTPLTLSSSIPARTGYGFLGWSADVNASTAAYKAGAVYSVEGNAVLYAVWGINTYTVSYDANGGANAPSSQTKTYGTSLNISNSIPTREGYDFLGWSPDKSAVLPVYKSGDSYSANSDTVLYAVWSIKKYTVTYSANGGSGAPAAQTKTHGESLTLSSKVPLRNDSYIFVGWGTSPSDRTAICQPGEKLDREGDITLYALWKCSPVFCEQPNGAYLMDDPGNYEVIRLWPCFRADGDWFGQPEGGDIYYTTDGTTPTRQSKRYDRENPPVISSPMTIKAAAFKENCIDSDIAEFRFIRAEKPTLISLDEYATYVNIRYLRPEGVKSVSAEVYLNGVEVTDLTKAIGEDIINVSGLEPELEYLFRIKAEFYNGTLYSDEIIAKTTQYISDACDIISVRRPSGAVIDRDAKTVKGARVTNRYEETELDITVSRNASWELYETAVDAATRRNAVEDKKVKLEAGKTKTVFIRITAQDGLHDNIYSVEIYRQSKSAPPVFSRSSEYVLPGTELALSADGDLIKYTLDGSDPSEVNGIVYTSPLKLDNTVIVRAAAKEKDKDEYSDIITKKYTVGGFAILDAPSGLKWDGTSATWNAVPDAVSYLLTVYRDGVKLGDSIRVDGTNYDLKEKLSKSGKYTFEVTAQGDKAVYFDSDAELSAEYEFIEAEATPTPEPTQMPSPTPTPEPTQMPSPTPTPTPTQMPSPTPTPTPTAAPDLQKEIEYRIKGREITIFIPYRHENLHPYIAAYDKNNRLLSVKEAVISPDGEGVSIKTSFNNGDKILLWDGVKPISEPIIR